MGPRPILRLAFAGATAALVVSACSGADDATDIRTTEPDVEVEATPAFLATVDDRTTADAFRYEMTMSMAADLGIIQLDAAPEEPIVTGAADTEGDSTMIVDGRPLVDEVLDHLSEDFGGDAGAAFAGELPTGDLTIEARTIGERVWVKAPMFAALAEAGPMVGGDPAIEALAPLAEHWGVADLDGLSGDDGGVGPMTRLRGMGSFGATQNADPMQLMALLDEATEVTDLGRSSIDGVEVTQMRAEVDVPTVLHAAGQGPVPGTEDAPTLDGATAVVDAWVDDDGLLRRLAVEVSIPELTGTGGLADSPMGAEATMGFVVDVFDHGATFDVTEPDEPNPIDLAEVAGDLLAPNTDS